MIPSYFIQLERMPLTPNGKIDKKVLPEPNGNMATGLEYEAPRNEVEEKLAEMWREALSIEKVGINENFFELGGNSMIVIQLASKINGFFQVNIELSSLFKYTNIKTLANQIYEKMYKDIEDNNVYLLNQEVDKKIFMLPPITGYGMVYKELATYISSHSVYAFDYIESENKIEEYIKLITDIQAKGPYVLFGYSSGGNLAYEIAKGLINSGYEVSDIIILDSSSRPPKNEKYYKDEEKVAAKAIDIILNARFFKKYFQSEYAKNRAYEKIKAYIFYFNSLIHEGTVNSRVHFLVAEAIGKRKRISKIEIKDWKALLDTKITFYKASGIHQQLLIGDYIKKNAKLINEILTKC
jgi:thioesterase domain-containing protein/acyl carrier protein